MNKIMSKIYLSKITNTDKCRRLIDKTTVSFFKAYSKKLFKFWSPLNLNWHLFTFYFEMVHISILKVELFSL